MNNLVDTANRICMEAHSGQVDKAGEQYSTHPQRAASHAMNIARLFFPALLEEEVIAVTLLHDVLEDCPDWNSARLIAEGIPEHLIPLIEAVTKRPGEARSDYLDRIAAAGPLALIVKLADLTDNTEPWRLSKLPAEKVEQLRAKYAPDLVKVKRAFAEAILAD